MKSVATAVCSQARKSDSVRNSNCKTTMPSSSQVQHSLVSQTVLVSCDTLEFETDPFCFLGLQCRTVVPEEKSDTNSFNVSIHLSIHPFRGWAGANKSLSVNYQLFHYVHLINGCSKTLASFNSHVSVIFVCNPTAVESCLAHNLCFSDVKITKKQRSDG